MTTQHITAGEDIRTPSVAEIPPLTVGACATLACVWEATAPKPGNVYRGADFEDLTYADFLSSAAVVGPILDRATQQGVGETVLEAITATQQAVGTNTNLGMMLLLAPLATVSQEKPLAEGIADVLCELTATDTHQVYEAIRVARPGGLGEVAEADVRSSHPPAIRLTKAMRLAEDRDLIARQYGNDFEQVFLAAEYLERGLQSGAVLGDAIVAAFLQMLAEYPDSLIARKCGPKVAQEVSVRAASFLDSKQAREYQNRLKTFDFWLRSDGHRRNPGTTADLIAAGLFVLLREQRIEWPVRFYRYDFETGDRS